MIMKHYTEEKYLQFINATNDLKTLVKALGTGYTEMNVASHILKLTQQGKVSQMKAMALLREQPQMIKFIGNKYLQKK